ncbi:MAG: carboxypeptidase-like regulatory domain-containing protein [Bacteroidota bacterium]
MKKSVTITIPEPCHEDWGNMTPTEQGRFCKSCTKEVIDFTKVSDQEIINKLKSGDNLCGRFTTSQLDREIATKHRSKGNLLPYAASLLLPLGLLGSSESIAQGGPILVENYHQSLEESSELSKALITVSGTITDAQHIPLVNAEVFVLETGASVRTAPDGSFKLVCVIGSTIYATKDGLSSKHVQLGTRDAQIDIQIEAPEEFDVILTGLIQTIPTECTDEVITPPEKGNQQPPKVGKVVVSPNQEDAKPVTIKVSGIVVDDDKRPLAGAIIVPQDRARITHTNNDGYYEIDVTPGSRLVFSFVGYQNKEIITSNTTKDVDLNVRLEGFKLGEIAVKYSTSRKKRHTPKRRTKK